jgi:hypothetical protein
MDCAPVVDAIALNFEHLHKQFCLHYWRRRNDILKFATESPKTKTWAAGDGGLFQALPEGDKRRVGCCQPHSEKRACTALFKATNGTDCQWGITLKRLPDGHWKPVLGSKPV